MSKNSKEEEEAKMENEILICGDDWLAVFDLIAPRQLGLEIALLSHRFDYYVDEHFKIRKWTLAPIGIGWKIGENGTKQMEIVNSRGEMVPFPQVPVPRNVVGFKHILINYIDQNVVDFLRLFRHTFASSATYLKIISANNGAFEFAMHNIWPLINDSICEMHLCVGIKLRQTRQFVLSFLRDCPSLRLLSSSYDVFPVFPSDDSANATMGQFVAKWLFSPPLMLDGAPKVLQCKLNSIVFSSKIDAFKTAFANASSRANFIIVITLTYLLFANTNAVVTFELIHNSTDERLTLKRRDNSQFLLVRCPIARDEQKWAKWEEVINWELIHPFNQITVHLPVL